MKHAAVIMLESIGFQPYATTQDQSGRPNFEVVFCVLLDRMQQNEKRNECSMPAFATFYSDQHLQGSNQFTNHLARKSPKSLKVRREMKLQNQKFRHIIRDEDQ